jgi:HPt (histidine-containing phosphotransfer) domain-containing protein
MSQTPEEKARAEKMIAAKARMAELAAKFVTRTRGEIATMRDALARVRCGDAAAIGEIRHFAHRMAGTGATLGFDALSDRAYAIEKLADAQPQGIAPDLSALARFESEIGALDVELRMLAGRIS